VKDVTWRRVAEMVRKEMKQLLRDPRSRAAIFVAPIVQLVMFGYAVNLDIRHTATFVVDLDRTATSRRLIETFQATEYFTVVARSERPADLVSALDAGRATVGLEIPRGFANAVAAGGPARVQVLLDGTNSNTATVALGYAQRIVEDFGEGAAAAPPVDIRLRAWYNPNLESRVYNVPGIVAVLVLLMCLLLTALAVVRERELGTLDQLLVSPLTTRELMLGKTIPVALIGLVDLTVISLLAVFWFDVPFRGSVFALAPAALFYIVAGLAIGLLISTVSRTQQEAFMAMFLFLLPAIILSGFFYPISSMPRVFQWLTLLNPVRHFLEIIRAIFLRGEGIVGLWPQYLVLAAMATGTLRFAVWRFPRTVGR
jgi:ABC-2 type transport system permease protein